jgi:ATP-dependent DNA helicase RecQ
MEDTGRGVSALKEPDLAAASQMAASPAVYGAPPLSAPTSQLPEESEGPVAAHTRPVTPAEPEDPIEVLARERFHVPRLMPLQRFVIANILDNIGHPEFSPAEERGNPGTDREIAGKAGHNETYNQLVLFPTGFGKSICFQLPALLLEGLTLVAYPLLALMNDQKRRLDEAHIPCALFRGGLGEEEWRAQEALIGSGKARMVVVNPEILGAPRLRRFLGRFRIAHFVIDEAHCISEWGETFRPSYLTLGESARALSPRILSAFTATAGPAIVESIENKLFLGKGYRLVTAEADRPNILYGVVHTLSPRRTLRQLLLSCKKPAIVFERSRPGTRIKAGYLKSIGFPETRFYHAGLSCAERKDIETWFQESDDAILVSTNAYGMGMDKKNIRTVIHTSLPDSAEAYIQEAGRGGRDGKNSLAILIDDLARSSAGRTQVQEGSTMQAVPSFMEANPVQVQDEGRQAPGEPHSGGSPSGGQKEDERSKVRSHPSELNRDGLHSSGPRSDRPSHLLRPDSDGPHLGGSRPAGETETFVQNLRSRRFSLYPSLETCRREFLLHLLGEKETPVCGSCDNCLEKMKVSPNPEKVEGAPDSTAEWQHLSGAEGFLEALFLCRAHQRQLTKAEFIRMLGLHGRGKGRFTGLLSGWTDEERKELVQALIELHVLCVIDRGPWKNSISLGPKGKIFVECARGLLRRT